MPVFESTSSPIFAPGVGLPADAVLGREERDQPQIGMARDQVDVRHAGAIDRAVVGDQPDPLAAEIGRQVLQEHVDAGPHRSIAVGRGDRADGRGLRGQQRDGDHP